MKEVIVYSILFLLLAPIALANVAPDPPQTPQGPETNSNEETEPEENTTTQESEEQTTTQNTQELEQLRQEISQLELELERTREEQEVEEQVAEETLTPSFIIAISSSLLTIILLVYLVLQRVKKSKPSAQLTSYITQCRSQGYTDQQIETALQQYNYPQKTIQKALK